ncbi:peroxiredoxin family protein [Fodinibius sp. AD559]|uniref:peroxiredoxin family protein n=1 Tax=Fodinibius sp. AD559 TaxID=3424179 RepID=UPI004046F15F
MKYFKPIFSLLILLTFASNIIAQNTTEVDSAFQARVDSAYSKIIPFKTDSLQKEYAKEFYHYHLNHPNTANGQLALKTAIGMWGNTGSIKRIEQVLPTIDKDSDLWSKFMLSVGNAYRINQERNWNEYITLLKELKNQLTHPVSKSYVLLELGEYNLTDNKINKAKLQFQKVIELDADSMLVLKASGNLQEFSSLKTGMVAPDFTAKTIYGQTIKLSEIDSKIVLLEFWATWCGPCLPEIPHLKKLNSSYSDQELQIISVALDSDLDKLDQFVEEREINWPQIQQPKMWKGKIAKAYSVLGIPRSFLIDNKGNIVAKDLRGNELREKVSELIE